MRQMLGILAVLLVAAAPQTSAADGRGAVVEPAASHPHVGMAGCHLGIVELLDDADRAAGFVGSPFTVGGFYGPGTAAIHMWHFTCDEFLVGRQQPRRAQLALASVLVEPPDGTPWPQYVIRPDREPGMAVHYLNTFDFYLHTAHTDHPGLAALLRRAGLPATYTPDMRFDRSARIDDPADVLDELAQLHDTATSATSRSGAVGMQVRATKQHPPHDHDNSWWFTHPEHGPVRLQLRLFDAIDKWCAYGLPDCATLRASGPLAELFDLPADGSRVRTDGLGIDHDRIPTGSLTVSTVTQFGRDVPPHPASSVLCELGGR